MSNNRVWLFRALIVAAAGLMLVAWYLPWWTIDIEALGTDIAQIRPWGLETSERLGGFEVLLKGAEMPPWFTPMMWAYLGVCLIALLIGLWGPERELNIGKFKINLARLVSFGKFSISLPFLLIAGVGVSYVVAAVVAAVFAGMQMGNLMNIPLQGRTFVDLGDPIVTYVDTRLLPGYYLVYVAGIVLIALALLRDKIIGEPKAQAYPQSKRATALGHSRI